MNSSPMSLTAVVPVVVDARKRAATLTPSAGLGRSASELTRMRSIPRPLLASLYVCD